MTHTEFVAMLEFFLKHTRFAYSCLEAWNSINIAKSNDLNSINLSPGFFYIAEISIYNTLLIELAKIYSTGKKDGGSIRKLINQVDANQTLFRKEDDIKGFLLEAEQKMAELSAEIELIDKRRNKYLAHNDKENLVQNFDISTQYPVPLNAIVKLLSLAESICLNLFNMLDSRTICCRIKNAGDLEVLLQHVKIES